LINTKQAKPAPVAPMGQKKAPLAQDKTESRGWIAALIRRARWPGGPVLPCLAKRCLYSLEYLCSLKLWQKRHTVGLWGRLGPRFSLTGAHRTKFIGIVAI